MFPMLTIWKFCEICEMLTSKTQSCSKKGYFTLNKPILDTNKLYWLHFKLASTWQPKQQHKKPRKSSATRHKSHAPMRMHRLCLLWLYFSCYVLSECDFSTMYELISLSHFTVQDCNSSLFVFINKFCDVHYGQLFRNRNVTKLQRSEKLGSAQKNCFN